MCLESKTIFSKIAKEDIICYKVIDIKGYSVYNRSYQYYEHKINKANGGFRLIKDILFFISFIKDILLLDMSLEYYIHLHLKNMH